MSSARGSPEDSPKVARSRKHMKIKLSLTIVLSRELSVNPLCQSGGFYTRCTSPIDLPLSLRMGHKTHCNSFTAPLLILETNKPLHSLSTQFDSCPSLPLIPMPPDPSSSSSNAFATSFAPPEPLINANQPSICMRMRPVPFF